MHIAYIIPTPLCVTKTNRAEIQGFGAGWFFSRAGDPANFLAAPAPAFFQAAPAQAPASDFFPKRLRLLVFFFRAAPAPRGPKKPAPAPDYWLSLGKYSFPRKLVR